MLSLASLGVAALSWLALTSVSSSLELDPQDLEFDIEWSAPPPK